MRSQTLFFFTFSVLWRSPLKIKMSEEYPLHEAALRGDYEKVKRLLEESYPVDTKNKDGSTALY
jgi:ankyrin repeat protein